MAEDLLYTQQTGLRYINTLSLGSYHLFSGKIRVHHGRDGATLLHEYWHHIQNSTTILGFERFHYFIQLIAHLGRLSRATNDWFLPLSRWHQTPDLHANPAVTEALDQIFLHKSLWDGLERPAPVLNFNPVGEPLNFDPFLLTEEGDLRITYFPFENNAGQYVGYPIGGTTVSEAGAFGLEQLYQKKSFPLRQLDLEAHFHYHFFPLLLAPIFRQQKLTYEGSYMLSELALTCATPSIGFLAAYEWFRRGLDQIKKSTDLLTHALAVADELRDTTKGNVALELDSLSWLTERMQGDDLIKQALAWQLEQLERGLRLRAEDPAFFLRQFVPFREKVMQDLMVQFPPLLYETTDDDHYHHATEEDIIFYEIREALYTLSQYLLFEPDSFLHGSIPIITRLVGSKTYQVESFTVNASDATAYDYVLHHLNLYSKKFTIL